MNIYDNVSLNSIYDQAGFTDITTSLIDDLVKMTTYKMDKALLKRLGIEEDPNQIIVLTNDLRNIISLVKKGDLTTLKTVRREEVSEIVEEIKRTFKIQNERR